MSGGTLKLAKDGVSAPPKSTGDDVALSLDLLKLVYRHDKDPASLVERARELKRLLLAPES